MNSERTDLFEPATHLLTSLMLEGKKKKAPMSMSQKAVYLYKRRRYYHMRKHFRVRSISRSMKIRSKGLAKRATTLYKAAKKRRKTMKFFGKRKRKH